MGFSNSYIPFPSRANVRGTYRRERESVEPIESYCPRQNGFMIDDLVGFIFCIMRNNPGLDPVII